MQSDLQILKDLLDECIELVDSLKLQAREDNDDSSYDTFGSVEVYLDQAIDELNTIQ